MGTTMRPSASRARSAATQRIEFGASSTAPQARAIPSASNVSMRRRSLPSPSGSRNRKPSAMPSWVAIGPCSTAPGGSANAPCTAGNSDWE
jgi:hypothetical protein